MSTPSASVLKLKDKLTKTYGDKSVMFASEIPQYETVSSGSLSLDYAIGIGGIPTNRAIEIGGEPGTGKTTLALHIVDNFLRKFEDKSAVFLDIENRLTADWVAAFVRDMDRVIVLKPDSMEEATNMYRDFVKTGEVCVAVVDSIGGAPTQRVIEKDATIGDVGGNALAVSRFAKFAQTLSGKYDCATIGINQVRADMSGYKRYTTPGGMAWVHAVSLRVELKKGKDKAFEGTGDDKIQVGNTVVARIHKNSLAAPYRTTLYWFYHVPCKYGFGIDQKEELSRLSMVTGAVEQRAQGSYYHPSFPDGKIRGKDNVVKYLDENPESFEAVKADVLAKLKGGNVDGVAMTFDGDNIDDNPADGTLPMRTLDDAREVTA